MTDVFESMFRFFGWWFINIDMLFTLFIVGGAALLFFKKHSWGRRLLIMGCGGLVFFAVVPVGLWGLEFLENRFPQQGALPSDVTGIIFLGGSFDKLTTEGRKETAYNMAGSRFFRFLELAQRYPHLRLACTGTPFETATAKKEIMAFGVNPDRVIFEDKSKDTKTNAAYTAALLHPKPDEKWVLVTSAYHMPRSVGLFRKAGFNVIPYPVDYHTPGKYEPWFFIGLQTNLLGWSANIREWLGMLINYIAGRSDDIFPSPSDLKVFN